MRQGGSSAPRAQRRAAECAVRGEPSGSRSRRAVRERLPDGGSAAGGRWERLPDAVRRRASGGDRPRFSGWRRGERQQQRPGACAPDRGWQGMVPRKAWRPERRRQGASAAVREPNRRTADSTAGEGGLGQGAAGDPGRDFGRTRGAAARIHPCFGAEPGGGSGCAGGPGARGAAAFERWRRRGSAERLRTAGELRRGERYGRGEPRGLRGRSPRDGGMPGRRADEGVSGTQPLRRRPSHPRR
jgi:hypothetical protein